VEDASAHSYGITGGVKAQEFHAASAGPEREIISIAFSGKMVYDCARS
jgi:hypothetical protein